MKAKEYLMKILLLLLSIHLSHVHTYTTPLSSPNPCANERVRLVVIAMNCYGGLFKHYHIINKYTETFMPFIKSITQDTIDPDVWLITYCLSLDKPKRVKIDNIKKYAAEQAKETRFDKKKPYHAAMIEANKLIKERAALDDQPRKVFLVTIMYLDYKVQHSLNMHPYLEHIYHHRLFIMLDSILPNGGAIISNETGIPEELITQVAYKTKHLDPIDNKHICKGLQYDSECDNSLQCLNNMVCLDRKCQCAHSGMLQTADFQYCRQSIYQKCKHSWSCHPGYRCELDICRPRLPNIICPQPCERSESCPQKMYCGPENICLYHTDHVWLNWIFFTPFPTKEQLTRQYQLQYYWIIMAGCFLVLTMMAVPSIIAYRIKKQTLVPEEIKQRISAIPSNIATRVSKIAESTRSTFSKAKFRKFSRFENWPARESDDD